MPLPGHPLSGPPRQSFLSPTALRPRHTTYAAKTTDTSMASPIESPSESPCGIGPWGCPLTAEVHRMKVVTTLVMNIPGISVTSADHVRPPRRSQTVHAIRVVADITWFPHAK